MGILIPLLLAFDKNWRTIIWSGIWAMGFLALSAGVFGWESWQLYFTETLEYQLYVMTGWYGIFLRMMPTFFAVAGTLGLRPEVAYLVHWPFAIALFGAIFRLFMVEQDPLKQAFCLACGTFVVSPYGFNYDMGALAVCAVLLLASPGLGGRYALFAVAVIAAIPAAIMNLGHDGLPIVPLLLEAGLAAIVMKNVRFFRRLAGA